MRSFQVFKAYLRRRRFYFKILLSFAALCACAVLFTSMFAMQLLGGRYEHKILEARRNELRQVVLYADQSLYQNVMNIINERILNDYTQSGFTRFYLNADSMTPYEYYRCHQEMRGLLLGVPMLKSITLYRRVNNFLIDSGYGLKPIPDNSARVLDAIFPFSTYQKFTSECQERILFCSADAFADTSRAYLTCFRAVPLYASLEEAIGFFAISLDQNVFLAQAKTLYPLQGPFFLVDKAGNTLITEVGGVNDFDALRGHALTVLDTENASITHNGVAYRVLYAEGALSGWRAISLVPADSLLAESTDAKRVVLTVALTLMGVSILFVHFITAHVYKPLNRLRHRAAGGQYAELDEISAIADIVDFLEDKVDDMKIANANNKDVLAYKALVDILHGTGFTEEELYERLSLSGIAFQANCCCLICIEFPASVFRSLSLEQREYLIQRARVFAQERFGIDALSISESRPENLTAILAHMDESRFEALLRERHDLLADLEPDLHMHVNLYISSLLTRLKDVAQAYGNALHAFQYAYLYGQSNVFLPEDINAWEAKPWVAEWSAFQRYEGALRAGQIDAAAAMLEAWKRQVEVGGYSVRSAGAFVMQLIHITVAVGKAQGLFYDPNIKEIVVNELNGMDSFSDSVARIHAILEHAQSAQPDEGSRRLCVEIMTYVRDNCAQELSLTTLAERFHIGASHLSRTFKATTGENLSLFIVNCRLEKAAQWLNDMPEKPVSEIASELGYLTPAYFTRLFKDKFGVTPSQYRKCL